MKRLKLLILALFTAISLGLPAKAAFAASIELAQADFDAAVCADEPAATAKGIKCFTGGLYTLAKGDYKLTSNITLPDDAGLFLNDNGDYTLDLGSYTLAGHNNGNVLGIMNFGHSTTITGGTITNSNDTVYVFGSNATFKNTTIKSTERDALYVADADTNGDNTPDTPSKTILENVTATGLVAVDGTSTLTINGGTYTGNMSAAASTYYDYMNQTGGGNLVINSGTFAGGTWGASAVYTYTNGTLTINGGTFTSSEDAGVMAEGGTKSVTITDGVFTGKYAGLSISDINTTVKLSGGTYKYTGESNEYRPAGAIVLTGTEQGSDLLKLLADGYKYTDETADKKVNTFEDPHGGDPEIYRFAFLTGKSVDIYKPNSSSEAAAATENDSTVGSPDSGFLTSGLANANARIIATAAAATILTGLGFVIYKTAKH